MREQAGSGKRKTEKTEKTTLDKLAPVKSYKLSSIWV